MIYGNNKVLPTVRRQTNGTEPSLKLDAHLFHLFDDGQANFIQEGLTTYK